MKELSLNILDIAENSISANASLISICVIQDTFENLLTITVADNGKGMSDSFLKKVTDPFSTTRKTRKVGMGISLLKMVSEQSGGNFEIESKVGTGTTVKATFQHNHIDRPPLGNIGQTISVLVSCNLAVDFIYEHIFNDKNFRFDTREIKEIIKEVPLNTPDVILWMQEYIKEGIESITS